MATKAKHTQTPWHARKEDGCPRSFIHTTVTDDYRCTTVVDDVSHANAEFIVKACNEYDSLVSQLGAIHSAILEKNTDGSLDGLLLLAISKSLESKGSE